MSTERYGVCKDSAVEWIGEIPVGWECFAFPFRSSCSNGVMPLRFKPEYWNGEIPLMASDEVWHGAKRKPPKLP